MPKLPVFTSKEKADLYFALGKAYEDIGDFKIYILEELRPNLINLEKHQDQLKDLEARLKDLRKPVDTINWQNAKFNLSDPTE